MPAKQHILVVDDEDSVRFAVAAFLKSRGYEVSLARNGAEAMAVLEQLGADLVVLDVELGDENGLEVLVTIKKAHPAVRVVILTGRGYEESLWEKARENGADGYMSKALPPSQLLMEVNRWLKHQKPGPSD